MHGGDSASLRGFNLSHTTEKQVNISCDILKDFMCTLICVGGKAK